MRLAFCAGRVRQTNLKEERKFFLDLMWLFQVYDAQMLPPVFGTKNVEPKSYNWLTSK
jgi:hypothetical protein